jgi:hypothetical protein
MKGDFTRDTFHSKKNFTGVLMQQGRVQLDADWNEQNDIVQRRIETETVDSMGGCGAPLHAAAFGAFTATAGLGAAEITHLTNLGILPLPPGDFLLSTGRYYAGGKLVENDTITSLSHQPHLPGAVPITANGVYLAYLDVWEHHVTYLEDADMREVALGGPDTATRKQQLWQVKLLPVANSTHCLSPLAAWDTLVQGSTGKLSARAQPEATSTDSCIVPASAGYRRLENQLYRVEIHKGGTLTPGPNQASFKWSRDNGSVVFAIDEFMGGQPTNRLRMQSLGRDNVLALRKGDWVEVLDSDEELSFTPGIIAQIDDIDQDDLVITLNTTVSGLDTARSPKVRRWDSPGELQARIPAGNQGYIALENGVEIKYSAGTFATGDYWLIPARTILGTPALEGTGGIEWPTDVTTGDPLAQSPAGIAHTYCRLAVITLDASSLAIEDCRRLFPPTTELVSLFYLSGDGQEAMPGDPLPQPLRVGVSNGQWPVANAPVHFNVIQGTGKLVWNGSAPAKDVLAYTNSQGVIEVDWTLDSTNTSQVVEARLEDAAAASRHLPVRFNANISLASQVSYTSRCEGLAKAETVQDALDQLCANAHLRYVGGDGQTGRTKEPLPFLLEVRLANGSWPLMKQKVIFKVVSGGGELVGGTGGALTVTTDAEGYASAQWVLGSPKEKQQVVAFWDKKEKYFIHFNAFFGIQSTQPREEHIHIVDVLIGDRPLQLHGVYPLGELFQGIRVVLDSPVESDFLMDNLSFYLEVQVPFPLDKDDVAMYGSELIGYRPLALIGKNRLENNNHIIVYEPVPPVAKYLEVLLMQVQENGLTEMVAVRLLVKGNFIYRHDPQVYLDGEAFAAAPQSTPTGLVLPSGDEVNGGNFETWFNLVRK